MPENVLDSSLKNWSAIFQEFEGAGLLLGNGASRSVSDKFRYESLFEISKSDMVEDPLGSHEVEIFNAFGTSNFEMVLGALHTAAIVNEKLGLPTSQIHSISEKIKNALVEAVNLKHPGFEWVEDILDNLSEEYKKYDFVFSTNYDLLTYWAILQDTRSFTDYFFSGSPHLMFNPTDTKIRGSQTKVLFLHGGLHLYLSPDGTTFKRRTGFRGDLLDLFSNEFGRAQPLFISEGTAADKRKAINRSDYLSFAFRQFENLENNLVVFGHSLSDQDKHLVSAMEGWGTRKIAISILHNNAPEAIRRQKAGYHEKLPSADLVFFDASSHPLGQQDLCTDEQA